MDNIYFGIVYYLNLTLNSSLSGIPTTSVLEDYTFRKVKIYPPVINCPYLLIYILSLITGHSIYT